MSERDEQISFFDFIPVLQAQHPNMADDLHWIHASMNGAWFKKAHMAMLAKEEGLTPGILDIFWAYNIGKYSGIYIEMKYGNNILTDNQAKYRAWVESQGYLVKVCYNWQKAVEAICAYASLPAPDFQ
jgi:hypothetical protein